MLDAADGPPIVKAPWRLRGNGYVLPLWLPGSAPGAGAAAVSLADGTAARRQPRRLGVLGFLRYSHSEVGAYDELFWLVPRGLWAGRHALHTIARIFVSSPHSQSNGRRNWGIPKELAEFHVESAGEGAAQRVRVVTGAGTIVSFVVTAGARFVRLDSRWLPAALQRLGQLTEEGLYEAEPRAAARLGAARFSKLVADPVAFVDLEHAVPLGGLALHELELFMPEARRTERARDTRPLTRSARLEPTGERRG